MPLPADSFSSLLPLWSVVGVVSGRQEIFSGGGAVLLDLTGCGGSSLAAHASGVDCFGGDQI